MSDERPPPSNKLGDMNGWTTALFKVQLIGTPIVFTAVIALGTWLVRSVNEVTRVQSVIGEKLEQVTRRYYSVDAARADNLLLKQEVLNEIAKRYPPAYLVRQVEALENRVNKLENGSL